MRTFCRKLSAFYEKLKLLKSGFIENSNFENDRDPCDKVSASGATSYDVPKNLADHWMHF